MSAELRATPTAVPMGRPPLDGQVAEIIRDLSLLDDDGGPRTAARARKGAHDAFEVLRGSDPDASVEEVDWEIVVRRFPHGDVSTREYWPRATSRDELTTTVVFLHGGGWVTGSASSYHDDTALLAARLRARVVSVDYRLAPEEPFPAAFDDSLAVVRAELEAGGARIVVAGDSAGGNLALATILATRDAPRRADALLLLYPALDPAEMGNATYRSNGEGYILETADIQFYYGAYLGADPERIGQFGAPLRAQSFAGLPPTIVVSAGYDPLLAENKSLAQRLIADDVPTVYLTNATLPHGFLQMRTRVDAARASMDQVFSAVQALTS